MIDKETIDMLKTIWNYMILNMEMEKSDLIIGCGCVNLEIPKKCAELLKQGYADKILFTGGFGKITNTKFKKSEAELYRDIALKEGIGKDKIYIENKSTNTGDNFRFSLKIIEENNIKADNIIIVHNKLSERRTLSAAKALMKNKKILITSPNMTFNDFITKMEKKTKEDRENNISVIVGDIQRLIIFPQLGWQTENKVPKEVINAYEVLKNKKYDKYIFKEEEIEELIKKYGIIEEKSANYFN